MQILPGFGGDAPPAPTPLPPVPTRADPEIAASKERLRQSELRRKGRRASILTSPKEEGGALGPGTSIERPQARAAQLLGG